MLNSFQHICYRLEPIQNLFPRSVAPLAAGQTVTVPQRTLVVRFLHLNGLSSSPEARLTFQKKILDGFLGENSSGLSER